MMNQAEPLLRRVPVGPVELAVSVVGRRQDEPVLCIHGSWDDHRSWDAVARSLSSDRLVATYDRRGHSASTDGTAPGTIVDDVEDAAGLIRALSWDAAHVVAHSYGACVAMVLAIRHPTLVRSLYLHEPPVFALLEPADRDLLQRAQAEMRRAADLLVGGDLEAGAIQFIEQVAFGAGAWSRDFDVTDRAIMLSNADTWLEQSRDPERLAIDLERFGSLAPAVTLSVGTESLVWFQAVTRAMLSRLPSGRLEPIEGAGHGAPRTHPNEFADGVRRHLERAE